MKNGSVDERQVMANTDPEVIRREIKDLRGCIARINTDRKELEEVLTDLMESTKEGLRQNKQWLKEYSESDNNEPPKSISKGIKKKRSVHKKKQKQS